MKLTTVFSAASISFFAVVISSCNPAKNETKAELSSSNPFLQPSTLSLQAPAFDKIKDGDYQPAIEEGIKQQQAEIGKIADSPDAPTFENTLVAMERSGQLLNRVNNVFNLVTGANTNPALQKVQEIVAPKLAANHDAIFLNSKLYQRVKGLYDKRADLKLDAESQRLLEYYEQKFELAGANLSDKAKDSLKNFNQEEAALSAKFTSQILAANKAGALVVDHKEDLAGLTDEEINAAADNARSAKHDGKWMLSLQNTTQQPALRQLSNRNTRKRLFDASYIRAERGDANDTRSTITRIAELHAMEAKLLGFKSFAGWKLKDQMAKTPQAVQTFLDQLVPAATAKARSEAADIQSVIDAQKGTFKVQPYDWNFYAEQVRKAKYNLDENEVKPYFELNKVLTDGVFYAANQLYGLTFKERKDLPVYQNDVRVFDVFDKDGSQLGLFYCDYYKRDNKNGGAWMDNLIGESKLLGTKPVIYNVCNFTKPAPGQPALISADDAKTMFHEFGHGLHGLFAAQQYPSVASPQTSRDFVEFPSQFNEHWAYDPKIFAHYAVHYKTGALMPQALVDKIKKAATFNQGYALTEALAADALDLKWNTLPANAGKQDVDKFESAALHSAGLDLPQVPPRYRSSYFLHIWSNGYAAGYYAYAWTEMLDDDAFSWFEQNGGLTRANGQRFRDMILSKGNTEDYGTMFKAFRGHAPDIHPMLVSRGLVK